MNRNLSRPWTRWSPRHRAVAVAVAAGTLAGGLGLNVATSGAALPTLCLARPSFADSRIQAKYEQWGGSGGQLGCALNNAHISEDGRAFIMDFRGGTITFLNQDLPPMVLLAENRDKWYDLRAHGVDLGYPRTDTFLLFTPDGELGAATELERGAAIYFAPSTGAHEVHGEIAAYHKANFAEIGFPTSDEEAFSEGGRASFFQHGKLYWWSDTGVINVPRNVVVNYKGIVAFEETDIDQASNSDEPYVNIGAVTPRTNITRRSNAYDDVDGGETVNDTIELYRGVPEGITLSVLLMEHDFSDPASFEQLVKTGADAAARQIAKLLEGVPLVGPTLGAIAEPVLQDVVPVVATFVTDFLDLKDDELGRQTIKVSAKEMIKMTARSHASERGIRYKIRTDEFKAGGAVYRVYFSVYNESA